MKNEKLKIMHAHSVFLPSGKIAHNKIIVINSQTNLIEKIENYTKWCKNNPAKQPDLVIPAEDIVVPAFVETHFHGFNGIDASEVKTTKEIRQLLKYQMQNGVATCFLTLVALDDATTLRILRLIHKVYQEQQLKKATRQEAQIAGVHLEAKFANVVKCGALKAKHIVAANLALFKRYQQAAGDLIKIVTVAAIPDGVSKRRINKHLHFIQELAKMGVCISIGHSNGNSSDWRRVVTALDATAKITQQPNVLRVTHFTNAFDKPAELQRFIDSHKPLLKDTLCDGILKTKTKQRNIYLELIVDNAHIPPAGMRWLLKQIKNNPALKPVLVTDSIQAAGVNRNCITTLGDSTVVVLNGFARVLNNWQDFFTLTQLNQYKRSPALFDRFLQRHSDFVQYVSRMHLAGSLLTMPEAIKNMARYVGLPAALQMATANAAASANLTTVGKIAVGYKANFAVLCSSRKM